MKKVSKKFAERLANSKIYFSDEGRIKLIVPLQDGTFVTLYQMNKSVKEPKNYSGYWGGYK
jgi:hypothetical protein